MAETNANIKVNVDTTQALAGVKGLQKNISRLYSEMSRGAQASGASIAGMQQNLVSSINATGQFNARITTIKTTTESFTDSLEKNKLSIGQTFRFAGASTKTFGRLFKTEFNTINKVAGERVKDLSTQFVKLGRDSSGAMKGISIRPTTLDMQNLGVQTAITAQKKQIFNQLLKQGTTNLLNFGKNTQWAGRQLMVGFTIPLSIFAMQASRSFQQLEKQTIQFRRVYGDLFTTPEEAEVALGEMRELAVEFTKLGVSIEDTLGLAAKVAQMGATGSELRAQVTEATRLSVLGAMEQQEALDTTIGLTNAFGVSIEDLTGKVNFLNAAENQTILSIQDFNEAVPRTGSVVRQLGGDVEDLAFFLTAMREGGIEATQGANALKSSLGRLINPTDAAAKRLGDLGINIKDIVQENAGDLRQTVVELAFELDKLSDLEQSQAIEQLFGKFQFARMSALFQNIVDEGSQANKVLELMGMSAGDLQRLADRELGRVEESAATKFTSAVAQFQAAIAPIGEEFLKLATPIVQFLADLIARFDNLSDGAKSFIIGFVGLLGGAMPVLLMLIGLVANFTANIAKGIGLAIKFFQKLFSSSKNLADQTTYLNSEQMESQTVAAALEQTHQTLTQTFNGEAEALHRLAEAYGAAITQMEGFQGPIMTSGAASPTVVPGFRRGKKAPGYEDGVVMVPGPKGAGDIMPAMLAPGEAVIPADMAKKHAGLINGMIADNIPGFRKGLPSDPVASHVSGFDARGLGPEIKRLADAGEKFSKTVLLVTRSIDGTTVSFEKFQGFVDDFIAQGSTVMAPGAFHGGTAVVESRSMNHMLNEMDKNVKGGGTSLDADSDVFSGTFKNFDELEAQGQALLQEQKNQTEFYKAHSAQVDERVQEYQRVNAELDQAVSEGADRHREILKIDQDRAKTIIEQGIVAQESVSQEEASTRASEQVAAMSLEYEQALAEGKSAEEALSQARDVLLKRTLENAEMLVVGAPGTPVDDVRAAATGRVSQSGSSRPETVTRDFDKGEVSPGVPATGPGIANLNPSKKASADQVATKLGIEFNEIGENLVNAAANALAAGAREAGQTASPSKVAGEIGANHSRGFTEGAETGVAEAGAVGEEIAEAVVEGASQGRVVEGSKSRRAQHPQGAPTDMLATTVSVGGDPHAEVMAAQAANAQTAEEFGNRLGNATEKVGDMSGKMLGAGFALSSLAGALSRVDGPVGDIASAALPVIGTLTAMSGILRMVNIQSLAGVVRKKAEAVSSAFLNVVRTKSTVAIIGNTTAAKLETAARLKNVVAMKAQRVGILAGIGLFLKGIAVAIGTLLGPITLIVGALALLAGGLFLLWKRSKEEEERIRGLGDAATFTAEQLKTLGDIAGVSFREDAAQGFSVGEGSRDAESISTVQALVDSEDFASGFAKEIETFKGANDEQLQRIVDAQTAFLAARLDPEEREKIPEMIEAMLIKAGKEDAPIEVIIPNFEELSSLEERVRAVAEPLEQISGGTEYDFFTGLPQLNEDLEISRGELASTFSAIMNLREAGELGPEEAAESVSKLTAAMAGMEDSAAQMELLEGVFGDLGMESLLEDIQDADMLLALLEQNAMGLDLNPETLEAFKEANEALAEKEHKRTEEQKEAIRVAKELTEANKDLSMARLEQLRLDQEAADAEAARTEQRDIEAAQVTEAKEKIEEQIGQLETQNLAYDRLIESGMDASAAIELVGDAALASAVALMEAGPEMDAFIERYNLLKVSEAETAKRFGRDRTSGGGGGGPASSPIDDITKKLRLFNNAQVSVTQGFDASMKAILAFANGTDALSGAFNGLNKQMRSVGLNENIIEMIAGMDPDEYEKRKNDLFIFDDRGTIIGVTAKLRSLNDALSSVVIGEFVNTQEDLVNSVNNQVVALNRLTAAGASYEAAYRAVQNTALAAAIATARSSEQIRAAANAAMQAQQMMDRLSTINEAEERRKGISKSVREMNKEFSNQAKILGFINKNRSRFSEAQVTEILNNKDLTALVLDPSIDPGALSRALDDANKRAQLELSIKKLTIEGQDEIFQEGLGKAMDAFNAEGQKIEFEVEANIGGQRNIIKEAEEQIALLDFELQTYQNDLKDIEFQEDEINKAYDKRFEALDKIAEANKEISRQQQAQLDVADALSRGDIAGAASAVRAAREAAGEAAREQERKRLEQAQRSQLAALTSARGVGREDAEAASLELEKQIFEIEVNRLQPAEELVRLAELKRDADIEALEVLGKTREEYEKIANSIDVARANNWKSTEAIQEALDIVEKLLAELAKPKPIPIPVAAPAPPRRSSPPRRSPAPAPAPATAPPPRPTPTQAELVQKSREEASKFLAKPGNAFDHGAHSRNASTPTPRFNLTLPGGSATTNVLGPTRPSPPPFMGVPKGTTLRAMMRNTGGMIVPKRMAGGGPAYPRMADGGLAKMMFGGGFASLGSDTIPAMLTPGEFVIRRPAVREIGVDSLENLNRNASMGGDVYNYSVSVNVKSDSNPDRIAKTVMDQIRRIDSQRVRGNRL